MTAAARAHERAMLAIAGVVDTSLFLGQHGVSSSVTRMAG